jgi:hypothetical protein
VALVGMPGFETRRPLTLSLVLVESISFPPRDLAALP